MDPELHQRLGDLWMATGNTNGAIMEYQAVVAGKPLDVAASHFKLAQALRSANRIDDVKEQLLLALEAAPGFKPAQRMLLPIIEAKPQKLFEAAWFIARLARLGSADDMRQPIKERWPSGLRQRS